MHLDRQRVAFEEKLFALLQPRQHISFTASASRLHLETKGSDRGEISLELVGQEMRDFSLLDYLKVEELDKFAAFLASALEDVKASRLRIGPFAQETGRILLSSLANPNFVFHCVPLSIEPLIDKSRGNGSLSRQSLRRAHRKAAAAGLKQSVRRFSAKEMQELHYARWGPNRSGQFFKILREFADESFCESITLADASGRVHGQQIDFCFADTRYFYYSISNESSPGIGTALLAESIARFHQNEPVQTYSFGRGGEPYKFRYAQVVRLNYYLVGLRSNQLEVHPWRRG